MAKRKVAAGHNFKRVLVANRGEIALRIIQTLKIRGIESVAVFSDADAHAPYVKAADRAVNLGASDPAASYLNIERIIKAATDSNSNAIHPGYGFLAENPAFARACLSSGMVFIGPTPEAMEAMGDKATARGYAASAGVPTIPAADASDDPQTIAASAKSMPLPLLLKAAAGGGGKGMRRLDDLSQLEESIEGARREALSAFGDSRLIVEQLIPAARHVEVQVMGDGKGTVVALGERECSLQRRHQKVLEESPSAAIDDQLRIRICEAACTVAKTVNYRGAGTVEFLVSDEGKFFFLEMNTRLQVEHPVTELCTGTDLVDWQLEVAAHHRLPEEAHALLPRGCAIEARVYAEDAERGFLPTSGNVHLLRWPTVAFVRVDAGIAEGQTIGSEYDPLLAKIISWGPDRKVATERLKGALEQTVILGLTTNLAFLIDLLASDMWRDGKTYTDSLEPWVRKRESILPDASTLAAFALGAATPAKQIASSEKAASDPHNPWKQVGNWRV